MSRRGITVSELLVTLTCLTVLFTLVVLATGCGKLADNRQQCGNNLKQLALGLQNYHDTFLYLPYGARNRTPANDPKNVSWGSSWLVATLGFCEQRPMFDKLYGTDIADPANDYISPTMLAAAVPHKPTTYFICPNTPMPKSQTMGQAKLDVPSYAGIMGANLPMDQRIVDGPYGGTAGLNGMLIPNDSLTFAACTDGTANTIIVGEVSNWYYDDKGTKRHTALSISDAGDGAKPEAGWLAGTNLKEVMPKSIAADQCLNLISLAHPVNANNRGAAADQAPNWGSGGVGRCGFNNPLSSAHGNGAMVGFVDGHVVLLTSDTALDVLQKLAVRDDGGATPRF
ncbi:DUF1559 family PulG-like putative transporter [Anatilimnocola floriformis]|uniref:DUF1559 family PulG-like putative transporter n=1 Tax=Anatilimnocola floriformis TaxID=2948575 RepID=UPI0020C483AA|nr:DUF1559 domain-containing protein [Anatilimnocola floriformis]